MPLIKSKSKKAFEKNVKTEMDAHPDKRKQDLAIAYSVQRKAAHRKKMESGGMVKHDMDEHFGSEPEAPMEGLDTHKSYPCAKCGHENIPPEGMLSAKEAESRSSMDESEDMENRAMMAEGGEVESFGKSIADSIMRKRRNESDSEVSDNGTETPNQYYGENEHDALDHDFDSILDDAGQPMDSNEDSRTLEDEDSHDMVSKIRKKYSKKMR